jgi:hypothetical protein
MLPRNNSLPYLFVLVAFVLLRKTRNSEERDRDVVMNVEKVSSDCH